MGSQFANADGLVVVNRLVDLIHENRDYLSEIDGKIGDGDHGINMDKGFQLTASRFEAGMSMSDGFRLLGRTLLREIGGSMGPLYGQFFKAMFRASKDEEKIDARVVAEMLAGAYAAVRELGEANPGDKTLVDTLDPACSAMRHLPEGVSFSAALDAMVQAAEAGWRSTENMVAKVGRSSRLGERSRGVLDAGATSCYLMLKSMAETMKELIA